MMRRAHINRMQRGRLMWFNLGDEEISGAQTLLRGRKWIWGSRAKPEEGGEGEKSHKLIRLWIFKIKIYLMLLDFVSGTFHCPKLLHGHFQGLGIHNHCGQSLPLRHWGDTWWNYIKYLLEKHGEKAWERNSGSLEWAQCVLGMWKEGEQRFPSWSYFRLLYFPWGIPIQQRILCHSCGVIERIFVIESYIRNLLKL